MSDAGVVSLAVAPEVDEHTFLMADIAGSSKLWNRHPERMAAALARHDQIAATVVATGSGELFKHTGDGFIASFESAEAAVGVAVGYQHALSAERWPGDVEIRSRVFLHSGVAESRGGDWFGSTMNHLARLTDLVEPTHIVMSIEAHRQLSDPLVLSLTDPLGAFRVKDVPEPVALFRVGGDRSTGPALTVSTGQGLPRPQTSFVGRDGDLEAVLGRIRTSAITTVLGFGGMGKTRLAVEVGHRWAAETEETQGHAYFTDLASYASPVEAIGVAVGLSPAILTGTAPVFPAMAKHMGPGPALLVLDNCEHVIEEAADAADQALRAMPNLKILATSREPLEIEGESVHRLSPLTPEPAEELLRERAALVGAGSLSGGELAPDVVARLCAAVEGLPLGIELVVARLAVVPADELADELDRGLGELRARRRSRRRQQRRGADASDGAASPASTDRHATIDALVRWSFDLLAADEQELLLRLSQLPAPWSRRTAIDLAPDLHDDLVDELVAKSLVSPGTAGQMRMLESVRQFCAAQLTENEDRATAAAHRLVDWALGVAPPLLSAAGLVFDAQQARSFNSQAPNLRVALAAAGRLGRNEDRAGVLTGLWPLAIDARARLWFDAEVTTCLETATGPTLRELLIRLGMQGQLGEYVDLQRNEELTALLRDIDPNGESPTWIVINAANALRDTLVVRVMGGDESEPRQRLIDAVAMAAECDHRIDQCIAELFLSYSYLLFDDQAAAIAAAEASAESGRHCQFSPLVALADATAGFGIARGGDIEGALRMTSAAVPLAEDARWEVSVHAAEALLLLRGVHSSDSDSDSDSKSNDGDGPVASAVASAVATTLDLAIGDGSPFVLFDAITVVAAHHVERGDVGRASAALEVVSIPRTPLTFAALFEVAAAADFDLGIDRFLETFDPTAFAARGQLAKRLLIEERAGLGSLPEVC